MARHFIYVLLAIKILLVVWGVFGLIEYFKPSVAFDLQDANFPPGVQFLHWLLILLTGSIFIFGFVRRWKHTPYVTMTMYATLATLCFVETVDFNSFGGGTIRFFYMTAEVTLYVVLATYLVRSKKVKERFGDKKEENDLGAAANNL